MTGSRFAPKLVLSAVGIALALGFAAAGATAQEKIIVVVPSTSPTASPTPDQRPQVLTTRFGSRSSTGLNGCKTEAAIKVVVDGLKADCEAWLKDRKADLKDKYLTGTCEESCDDCNTGLKRCTVGGTVHYNNR